MLDYIIHQDAYTKVKGRKLYHAMETAKILDNRTWLSMRNRFTYYIGPNLEQYDLTDYQIHQFKKFLKPVSKNIKEYM